MVDRFSKISHFNPGRKTIDASNVVRLLFKEIVRLHQIPKLIISDVDTRLINYLWIFL